MSTICMVCGKINDKVVCDSCKATTDIDRLCDEIIEYKPNIPENPNANLIWEKAATTLGEKEKFSKFAFELADELESPRKEYQKIHSLVGEYPGIVKAHRSWLYEIYKTIDFAALSEWEVLRIKGIMLEALFKDYRYKEAEKLATELVELVELPWQAAITVADFFNKTRRYDAAEQVIYNISPKFENDEYAKKQFENQMDACNKYRAASENGKKEYMPNPKEDREKAIQSYINFMESIGIDIQKVSKAPMAIPKVDYPDPAIIHTPNFNSFVAFDFETTGLSSATDCIIEVGAIKVINGKIVESKEFVFSEFVKPYKKSVNEKVTELTGITKDDVKNARPMWEVIPDFMNFVGEHVLVGYNNASFDSKFLARAGRHSNLMIQNPHFDVLQYARHIKDEINYTNDDFTLASVAKFCGVENPKAHRAWADALTTAKVYLKLRELSK